MSDDLRCRSQYVVGLGANLGDRRAALQSAVLALAALGWVRQLSDLYETAAVGPAQPDYLNAAVLLESGLPPGASMAALLEIERDHGRERRERWGPRTLDLYLLCSPGLVREEPGLTLPHPEVGRRAFALVPLLDVLPDARDARSGVGYRELLAGLESASVRRVETRSSWDPRGALEQAPGRTE
jgi:2-amino-4-hydroxy-6-hydroxymethyldihydropteridine diphosphokinase